MKITLSAIARLRSPRIDGDIKLPALHGSIEILRDRWGIPHIYAHDLHDLFFAQGFVHAQDRLWQLDFNRRLVAGRLSEILGNVSVPVDRWMRTLTMRRVAEYEVSLLNDDARSAFQAYADGINAFIQRGPLPIEFTLLRYRPDPWIIADSLAWIKMMSWSLCVNWEKEILNARLLEQLGPDLFAELEAPYLDRWPRTIPAGSDYSSIGEVALQRLQAARPFTGPSPYEGLGSNNWVVHGSRTQTGMPLLANDMHLAMSLPSIWYENHLVSDEINMIGVMFPGLPGIIAGHNGYVAWGHTDGFPDVQDLYMERLRRTPQGTVQAEYNGQWEQARLVHEIIHVKGGSDVVEEVVITRHGPIINSLAPDFSGEQPLALHWTSLEPDTMAHSLFDMFRSRNCQEFHNALRGWTAPVQNIVYADRDGNIGYTFPGKVPIRLSGNGQLPVPGWTDEYEWMGYVPYEQLPHLYNPPQGFVATANNYPISPDYPIHLEVEEITGDRAQRITELIRANARIDIPYIQKMHFDLLSPSARQMADIIKTLPIPEEKVSPDLQVAIRHLRSWDGTLSSEGPAPAIYQVFIRKLVRAILLNKIKDNDLVDRLMGKGPTPLIAEGSVSGAHRESWLFNLLEQPDSHWFDLGHGANRDEVSRQALQDALEELRSLLGNDVEKWGWGKLHSLTYRHTLAAARPLQAFFNRGPFPMGGDGTTIWATGSRFYDLNTDAIVGPPYRFIVDLGDLSRSVSLLAPGQSGNPTSPFYDDQVKAWFTGGYHPMLYQRPEIEAHTRAILRLIPKI